MLIYALIPARSGSKGIKNKNIKLVKKKYLINYTIEFSLKCKSIDRTFVSTDSEKIRNISLDTGSEVPFLRLKKISRDKSSDIQCFQHFHKFLIKKNIKIPDYYLHLRVTSPIRSNKQIETAIKKLKKLKPDSLRFIKKTNYSAFKLWQIKKNYIEPFLKSKKEYHSMGRQFLPQTYIHSGIGDFISPRAIENNSMVGKKTAYILDNAKKYIDIDDLDDLKYFEKLI